MRIAIIQPIVSPTRIPWLHELATHEDLEVTVFSLRDTLDHRPGWRTEDSERYNTIRVPSFVLKEPWKFADDIRPDVGHRIIPVGLTLKLIMYRPDIIIVTNATEMISAVLTRLFSRARVVLLAEDTPLSFSHIGSRRQTMKSLLYKSADIVCAHSSQTVELLSSLGVDNKKIAFTPWAVDSSKFVADSKLVDPAVIRERYHLNGTVFITIGSLTQRKGMSYLLKAWAASEARKRDDATLLIVGDGPERDSIKKMISDLNIDNISMTGHIPPEEIATCLNASDVFVFPTLEDVWGLVMNEAMALGLPVLCSRYAGSSGDLVDEGRNGAIIDPYDTDSLAATIDDFLRISREDGLSSYSEASENIIRDITIANSVNGLIDKISNERSA